VIARIVAALVLTQVPHTVAFHFTDPAITESSGLVALPNGMFVTTNDSGDSGRVFVVDGDGKTRRESDWSETATDVEALAPVGWPAAEDRVWVGDIGDNAASRDSILITQAKVGLGGAETQEGIVPTQYRYPDGSHDAETLMEAPDGRLLIVTKGFLGGTLYATVGGTAELEQISSPNAMAPMATDGAFLPDGKHFLVRGYTSATLYAWPSLERLGSMLLPAQKQGEGLAVDSTGTLWLTSEGVNSAVLRVPLNPALAELVAGDDGAAVPTEPEATPGPEEPVVDVTDEPRIEWVGWAAGGAILVGLMTYLIRRRH
jgi:hypothetical protein